MLKDTRTSLKTSRLRDDSIIDVTGKSFAIDKNNYLKKYTPGVPHWDQYYIYSYGEIYKATKEQRNFYVLFKINFLNGVFYDLEGNDNYAFILLFDFFDEYDIHKKNINIEKHLRWLGDIYPKTKEYVERFLAKKKEEKIQKEEAPFFRDNYFTTDYKYYDAGYYRLGNQYKAKLDLSSEEVNLLNRIWTPNNNFWSIDQGAIETVKLFLASIKELQKQFISEATTLDDQLAALAVIIIRYQYRYRPGSTNYKFQVNASNADLLSFILKLCENTVREVYNHKRKLPVRILFPHKIIAAELENRITSKLNNILSELRNRITPPTRETEIALNEKNDSRWKIGLEEISDKYSKNPKRFFQEVIDLGNLNLRNPYLPKIYAEAAKLILPADKITALKLYIISFYCGFRYSNFELKKFSKAVEKSLFNNKKQLHFFEKVISQLIQDRNINKAVEEIAEIYTPERKKIVLDPLSIEAVQEQHLGTVELLNEYLKDEYEDDQVLIKAESIDEDAIRLDITQKTDEELTQFRSDLVLTPVQSDLLELFLKNNYALSSEELEEYAKSKYVFKNQLVESINEACYEILDDVLIEEDEDYFAMNQDYYNRLLVI